LRELWIAFLRLFFRLLYNELAWSYDVVASLVSRGQWEAWSRRALAHLQGERVLELGHGPGHLLIAMAERGFSPLGLDLSSYMGRRAQQRLRGAGVSIPLVQARAQALPLRDGSLDSAVATFPTDFIADSRTLGEVVRVLEPEGRLVVAVCARFDGKELVSRFLTWLFRATGQSEPSPYRLKPLLAPVGLSAKVVWERVGSAAVMVVVADKVGGI
jgi:ubiquinone/menaquinone biosynthesis C-methylase UbiE